MKRILYFVLPILMIISFGFIIFGVLQARAEEEKMLEELKRKARAVAESIEFSAKYFIINKDVKNLKRLVDKFQTRERLQGCAIYNKDGHIMAITERYVEWKNKDKPYIGEVLAIRAPRGGIEQFQRQKVYSFSLPISGDNNELLGVVEVIYDTTYTYAALSDNWRRISITLALLVSFILAVVLYLQKQVFTQPIERLTEWFRKFQSGETNASQPLKEEGELGKLASEVEQVALTLRISRKSMSEKAKTRLKEEELWTEAKLRNWVHSKLGENPFFVVSNREPYIHVLDESTGIPKCIQPASGMVTAIDPIMRACGGTWIAHGSGNADEQFVNSKNKLGVPPEDDRYILKRVWLTKEEEAGYYYGFSNEGLWPLCHITHTRPIFRESDWQLYQNVNRKFADKILEELPGGNPFIFIQDYHFSLLGKMIKEARPDAIVALFWHIPWPNPEVFSICPYQQEILTGMLGCDLLGFHVQYHCNNFLETANRLLESRIDAERHCVIQGGKETLIRAFPISVDGFFDVKGEGKVPKKRMIGKIDLKDKLIALGVERLDYSKGIGEKILAVDRFLDKYPQYHGKFHLLQIASPSRTHIKRYHDLMSEIDELVEKVNWKHSKGNWKPVLYFKRHYSPAEVRELYDLADICIVSSLHDGMNLVAKEYIASRQDLKGMLVLSCFTGASRELTDAVIINPYSIEQFADGIKNALEMPAEERERRMASMRDIIKEHNIYHWAADIMTELASIKKT